MSYLFESAIEPAIKVEQLKANATNLKSRFESKTASLLTSKRRTNDIHDDFQKAKELVGTMGSKHRGTDKLAPHAWNYVESWASVSGNNEALQRMVSSELDTAYRIGLDIRSPDVIGTMFDLAAQVWSSLGAYTGYSQDEGRR
jgi:hypothetical protein